VHCNAIGTTLSETLGSIPETWCENNETGVSFEWKVRSGGRLDLILRYYADNDVVKVRALYTVPPEDIPMLGSGMFQHQVYTGPENFSIPAYRVGF
jgi:hypothetical protein